MKKKYSLFSVIRWDTFPKAPSKLRIAFFFFFFFMNGNTERAKCALSRVCIPWKKGKEV